ncbi:unnamed protein product [Moneuplotes crassus]|uniref:Uncharacterized protein n=1 Tax=Euplotes crassus TaxID=5936 RepID=A0AAD1U1S3_EUPCR|nr:unnamed protein product [Moneuplotes crassus]
MTKKVEKKLKGLLAAQDLNDCQSTFGCLLQYRKQSFPNQEERSYKGEQLKHISVFCCVVNEEENRIKQFQEIKAQVGLVCTTIHRVETLTKKKIIKRFFNSKAFLKHQERFGNLLDDSNSFERFNAYKRTSFLTTFSSQADMAQRKKMKKHKGTY